jgi:hypothetical protein
VVRLAPNLAEPYRTLGAVHEDMQQPRRALDFYMIAGHLARGVRGEAAQGSRCRGQPQLR